MTFQQVVTAEPRGRIRYRIDVIATYPNEAVGYQLSRHFAATNSSGEWRLTHLPSGRSVPYATTRTLAGMRTIATRLETLAQWGRYHSGRLPGRVIRRRLAKTFGWKLRRVA